MAESRLITTFFVHCRRCMRGCARGLNLHNFLGQRDTSSTRRIIFKFGVDTQGRLLSNRGLSGALAASPPGRAITSRTSGSEPDYPVGNLVVSKNPAVRRRTGHCFRFCSLTIEFEGRETQTAGSWRICDRKVGNQTDSG